MRILDRLWLQLRRAAHLQLLIALESGESETLIGGQAVIEGVMMRAPHSWAVAVRRPDGSIISRTKPLQKFSDKHRAWRWPLLRGLATLAEAMTLGIRALRFSAGAALEEDGAAKEASKEPGKWAVLTSALGSLAFFVAFYKFLPLLAATELQKWVPAFRGQILFNLVDGLIRVLLFILFLAGLSLFRDIRRVFEYHGAEHKVVFNFESGQPVEVAQARQFTTLHPRCGTSFMIVIMLIATAVYTVIPAHTFAMRLLVRVLLLPVIAGASYELIRYSARKQQSFFALLTRPGLWLQRITTREPDDQQLACSVQALEDAMALEAAQGGELVIA
jgi:uncharacterized protein YqhQ